MKLLTPTHPREARRQKYANALETAIRDAVESETELATEEGFDGEPDYKVIPETRLHLELEDDAALGFVADDSPVVHGYIGDCEYEATCRQVSRVRKGKSLTVVLKVTVEQV